MSNLSHFESRKGNIHAGAEDIFNFVTDIRNFERFAPGGTINNWNAGKESCSFSVPMIGTVSIRLIEQLPFSKVVYQGDALKKEDFTMTANLSETQPGNTEVKVILEADLNPMMKMMAANPINQFLEMLIKEMETFKDWK